MLDEQERPLQALLVLLSGLSIQASWPACGNQRQGFSLRTCCVGEAVLVGNDVAAINLGGCVDAL
jgi:hypothetical protein